VVIKFSIVCGKTFYHDDGDKTRKGETGKPPSSAKRGWGRFESQD
jgi:hypothetical protein